MLVFAGSDLVADARIWHRFYQVSLTVDDLLAQQKAAYRRSATAVHRRSVASDNCRRLPHGDCLLPA